MLRAHYPERGPSWAGWREVLPNRTRSAIVKHARSLGLCNRVPKDEAPEQTGMAGRHGEYVREVRRRMASGMAPSQIDREMHWPEGRAKQILMDTWERE